MGIVTETFISVGKESGDSHRPLQQSSSMLKSPGNSHLCWAIQRSWFARVNALCNLSAKKSREVAAHFWADF